MTTDRAESSRLRTAPFSTYSGFAGARPSARLRLWAAEQRHIGMILNGETEAKVSNTQR